MNMSQQAAGFSKKLKAEADRLLAETKLVELLNQFGDVSLGGSYAYNLLVDRDLDFGVIVSSVTPQSRAKIMSLFASQPWAYSVKITDRVNFKPRSHMGAPLGLYLGLTIPFPEERWNVDVWFMVASEPIEDKLADLVEQATPEQKAIILTIKYELMKNGEKEKGLTSASIYKAVIRDSVSSTKEFLAR